MAEYIVKNDCRACMTTGVGKKFDGAGVLVDIDPCPACGGDGYVNVGVVNLDDLESKIDDIMDKCRDIFEKVNE